jgi:hypothetical protein
MLACGCLENLTQHRLLIERRKERRVESAGAAATASSSATATSARRAVRGAIGPVGQHWAQSRLHRKPLLDAEGRHSEEAIGPIDPRRIIRCRGR